ncbi:MAG: asparaginase [Pseudomonadota bacterium]
MSDAVPFAEIWRGDFLESIHRGHAVICDDTGQIVTAWGNPDLVILPRSSAKMIQALPLISSGAAASVGLTTEHLALACASHQGAPIHTDRVTAWLTDIGLTDEDLICGPQMPRAVEDRDILIRAGQTPRRVHNNCSGKHAGFLTLARHIGAGSDYGDPVKPVQKAVKTAFEEVTGAATPGFGIDGCSAPNFATTLHAFARALAWFASAADRPGANAKAAVSLVDAMCSHPELVAGEDRACTDLMRAMGGRVALKTGAEGVFAAILPDQKLGIAVKAADGATRAAETAICALLVRCGALEAEHPATRHYMTPDITNWDGLVTGFMRPDPALFSA